MKRERHRSLLKVERPMDVIYVSLRGLYCTLASCKPNLRSHPPGAAQPRARLSAAGPAAIS